MLYSTFDDDQRLKLPNDPLGSACFLSPSEKEAVFDLVPLFRPDAKGHPSPHALMVCALLGLPRSGEGIPFASNVMSALMYGDETRRHTLRLQRWVEDLNREADGQLYLHFTPADIAAHRARTIDAFEIAPELQELLFASPLAPGFVDLATGRKLSQAGIEQARRNRISGAMQQAGDADDEQARLLDYLHHLPAQLFTQDKKSRYAKARAWIETTYRIEAGMSDLVMRKRFNGRLYASRMLRKTELYPKPTYQSSGMTARLNPFGAGLLGLPTAVRHILRPDDIDFDLKDAHLTIFASLFGATGISRALDEKNLWATLASALGPKWTPEDAKEALKQNAVLPMIYGSPEHQVRYRLKRQARLTEAEISRVLNHSLMQELRAVVDDALARCICEDGLHGADGRYYPLDTVLQHKAKRQRDDGTWIGGNRTIESGARSVLALVNQSYEWALMRPVREAAYRTNAWSITVWQHDGCAIRFRRVGSEDKIVKELTAQIAAEGARYGMDINASVKYAA